MKLHQIFPVILSGGIGSRLWPLSRQLRPKQFLNLLGDGLSLFGATLRHVKSEEYTRPFIVGNSEHRFLIAEELRKAEVDPHEIILETVPRNTAPAITVAALKIFSVKSDAIIVVMPSDQVISNSQAFTKAVLAAEELASKGMIVTFGVKPKRPETGYGYIKSGVPVSSGYKVDQFIEKPSQVMAQTYFESGEYYWNAGVFVFRADKFLSEVRAFSPDIYTAAKGALDSAVSDFDFLRLDEKSFEMAPNVSVDVAIMEKSRNSAVIPLPVEWSDVGSWAGLSEIGVTDNDGNVCVGNTVAMDAHDNYIYSEKPLVAVLGIDGIALVATDDSVLAVPKSKSQEVKNLVEKMKSQHKDETISHTQVYRPWGHYLNIDSGEGYLVKQIVVNPGARLSLQYHNHRAEHWVVVEGVARVTNDTAIMDLYPNQSTYIPVGTKHRLENLTNEALRLIEVQTGDMISEDDIIRIDDNYGRS